MILRVFAWHFLNGKLKLSWKEFHRRLGKGRTAYYWQAHHTNHDPSGTLSNCLEIASHSRNQREQKMTWFCALDLISHVADKCAASCCRSFAGYVMSKFFSCLCVRFRCLLHLAVADCWLDFPLRASRCECARVGNAQVQPFPFAQVSWACGQGRGGPSPRLFGSLSKAGYQIDSCMYACMHVCMYLCMDSRMYIERLLHHKPCELWPKLLVSHATVKRCFDDPVG